MLWGPIGLVLATPLTVCLVVLGRHVERLTFLDVLLGDQPALQPWELFYQRMLAGDAPEASEQATQFLKERSLLGLLRRHRAAVACNSRRRTSPPAHWTWSAPK